MAGKTLFVSDFDDTLAKTDAEVIVIKASGETVRMKPDKYAVYEPQPDDKFDFSEFEQLKNPRPIQRFVKLLRQAGPDGKADKVVVLTARGHTRPVAQFLKMMGITSGITIAALGDSDPKKKARYIEKQIHDGFTRVAFVDDSPKNVKAVEMLRAKYPDVKLLVHQAKTQSEHPPVVEPKKEPTNQEKEPESDSQVSQQAKAMGLTYLGFGRYGKDKKVTHTVQNGKLVQKQKTT